MGGLKKGVGRSGALKAGAISGSGGCGVACGMTARSLARAGAWAQGHLHESPLQKSL